MGDSEKVEMEKRFEDLQKSMEDERNLHKKMIREVKECEELKTERLLLALRLENEDLKLKNSKLQETILKLDGFVTAQKSENIRLKKEMSENKEQTAIPEMDMKRLIAVERGMRAIVDDKEGKGCTLRDIEIQRAVKGIMQGQSVSEVSRKVGVSRSSVSKIRNGTYGPKAKRKVLKNIDILIKKSQDRVYIEGLEKLRDKNQKDS